MPRKDRYTRTSDRWGANRKAEMLLTVTKGGRNADDVARENGFTPEEFAAMLKLFEKYGTHGLRARRLQIYTGRQYDGDKRLRPSIMVRSDYVKG